MLGRLGIAETLKPKIVRTSPLGIFGLAPKGHGDDIAAGTIPLIATTPGIKSLVPLPDDLQEYLTYTAAPLSDTRYHDAAEDVIRFLTSPKAKGTFTANGAS